MGKDTTNPQPTPQPPAGFSLAVTNPPPVAKRLPDGFTLSTGGVVYCIPCGLTTCRHFAEAGLR